nr:uncharacterized protein LOC129387073 [Dermacentor andersoni]
MDSVLLSSPRNQPSGQRSLSGGWPERLTCDSQLVPPARDGLAPRSGEDEAPLGEGGPPEDCSSRHRSSAYCLFVLSVALTTSAVMLVAPTALLTTAGLRGRISLGEELQATLDHTVHPCDDFYRPLECCDGSSLLRVEADSRLADDVVQEQRLILLKAGELLCPWEGREQSGYGPEFYAQQPGQNTAAAVCSCRQAACQSKGAPSQSKGAPVARSAIPHPDLWHVCGAWDGKRRHFLSPFDKYNYAYSEGIVKDMLLQHIPLRSTKAKEKAAGFMFRCLSRTEGQNTSMLSAFLKELGLPWPSRSSATRPQLLGLLVRASLQFGMPMFWAFYVGRHPHKSSENTLYMTLDPRFEQWIDDIEALRNEDKAHDYLRRCAEIVGGKGQSYSRMIRHVLLAHDAVVELVRLRWGPDAVPRFYSLSDPDLRRAVNGHLPDDSQLWPVDEIVNMQPDFFAALDATHLSLSGYQERFKLFLGAYVVWVLSPMVSPYLTSSMLADMHRQVSENSHRFFKCLESMATLLPLVKWQLHRDAQGDLAPTWNIFRMAALSTTTWLSFYSDTMRKHMRALLARMVVNAFNMTNTWDMLDNAFAYLPNDTSGTFFELYRRQASATVAFFKQSLNRPQHSIYHVPGIASHQLYRLLVGRQVTVYHFHTSAPLYKPWYPVSVVAALAGTFVSGQIVTLIRFAFYYGMRFEEYSKEQFKPGAWQLYMDVLRFIAVLNASAILPGASLRELREVYVQSVGAHIASGLSALSEGIHSGGTHAFSGIPAEQLFFLIKCFSLCGKSGRVLQGNVSCL